MQYFRFIENILISFFDRIWNTLPGIGAAAVILLTAY